MKNLDGTYTPNTTTIMLKAEKFYPSRRSLKYKPKRINIDAILVNISKQGEYLPRIRINNGN